VASGARGNGGGGSAAQSRDRRSDLGGEPRPAFDLLADEEEDRLYGCLFKEIEHRRSPLRMGSVVKHDDDPAGGVEPGPHSKRRAKLSARAGCAWKPVCGDASPAIAGSASALRRRLATASLALRSDSE
jgi:hypothetical protein